MFLSVPVATYRLCLYSCAMSTLRVAPEPSKGITQRVAEEVRAQMARKNVTQVRLAQVLDLPQSSVSLRVRGKRPFALPELERLADLFEVHLAVLFGLPAPSPDRPDGDPASRDFGSTHRLAEQLALLSDDAPPDPPVDMASAA